MSEKTQKGTPPKRRKNWRRAFLAALAKEGCVEFAAKKAKIGRRFVYKVRKANPKFKRAWDEALDAADDDLLLTARRRAKKKSDRLLMFLLAAHRPKIYGKQMRIKKDTRVRVQVTIEDLAEARKELQVWEHEKRNGKTLPSGG